MCTWERSQPIVRAPIALAASCPDLVATAPHPDLSGRVLGGQYRLLRRLVDDGGAATYEAEHAQSQRRLILKVVPPHAAPEQHFFAGAHAAVIVRHEYLIDIIGITDSGCDQQAGEAPVTYLAMEILTGESLATTLAMDGPLRWTRVLSIARQICRALVDASDRGIGHGDIRLDTCFRCSRPDTADFIELLDFRAAAPAAGASGDVTHALHHQRAHLHSLGVLMYQLLTGESPYTGAGGPADDGATQTPVPMRRTLPSLEISPAFEALVLRALIRDPDECFADPRVMLAALMAAEPAASRASYLPSNPLSWGAGSLLAP